MAAGLVVAGLGFALFTQIDVASGVGMLIIASVVVALGLAPVFTLATDVVIGSAPVERAGAAAAISETSSEFGGALGIAVLGSIGAAVYRGTMTSSLPASVAPDLAEAARTTLAGAAAVADLLPGAAGAEVLETARHAFAQSFDVTAVLTAGVVLITAALVAVVFRGDATEAENAPDAQAIAVACAG
jgi:DHA2 family multidrug resistance protein-like MFS transporter